VIASEQEHGNIGIRQSANALRKLALVGLTGLPVFIGVTAKKNQVNLILKGIVNELVK
jgi:hypothetical protein